MMNNALYFILKALFVLNISHFCPNFFYHVGKQLRKKAQVNFKIYDVTNWNTSNYNKHIARYLEK